MTTNQPSVTGARPESTCSRRASSIMVSESRSERRGLPLAQELRAPELEPAAADPATIERLLRSGLVGRAVNAMSACGRLEFGIPQHQDAGTMMFIACDDPRRIAAISNSIQQDRISAGKIGSPTRLEGSGGPLELSVDQWVIATERVPGEPALHGRPDRRAHGRNAR